MTTGYYEVDLSVPGLIPAALELLLGGKGEE